MSDSRDSTTMGGSSGNINTCVVCYKDVEIYSIGLCEHPVCYECSTRMRVLCQQNECPICRQDLPKVVFTKIVKPFRHLRRSNLLDTKYNIYFDSPDIQEKFNALLAHTCSICKGREPFASFNELKDHMRRKHELHYCDLCVENLKIFSQERRCYTRSNLSQHRRKGDVDDKSHKGHPLCEFCDQRYMDNDELYRHVRRDHLYCHFCDADGYHHYYNSYSDLREHFRNEHFLCEEGSCVEEIFTGVFRTDIDLKAHKACIHGKHLGKAAAKQARTLELEFTLAPRRENRNGRRPMLGSSNGNASSSQANSRRNFNGRDQLSEGADSGNIVQVDHLESVSFVRQPDVRSTEEFPSLGNASAAIPNMGQSRGRGNLTIRGSLRPQALAVTDENFPALDPASPAAPSGSGLTSAISKTVNLNVYSNKADSGQRPKSVAPNVSIQVNHKTDGTVTTRVTGPNIRIRPAQRSSMDCNFPALGRSSAVTDSTPSTTSGQWTKVTCVKPAPVQTPKVKKVAPSPFAEAPRLPSSDDFPSLSKPKKQLSISVVPQQSAWVQPPQTSKNSENEAKSVADATKGKAKKKKSKQNNGNNSNGNESTNSKSNVASKQEMNRNDKIDASLSKNGENSKKENEKNSQRIDDSNKQKENEKSKKDKKKDANNDNSVNKEIRQETSVTKNNGEVTPRKRSELKIDSINSKENVFSLNENFPSLSISKTVSSNENGKLAKKVTNPPPGFGSATPPPPGFAVRICENDRTAKLNETGGLTFTSSSGESYSILPTKTEENRIHVYAPPIDFQKRNKKLVERVTEILGNQEAIQEFRSLSGSFRQENCSAEEYYKRCSEAMGLSAFHSVFPEMLALLPDIEKQQELYLVHTQQNGKSKTLEPCTTCGQILKLGPDQKAHFWSHTMENHFPALGDSSNAIPSTTWVARKV